MGQITQFLFLFVLAGRALACVEVPLASPPSGSVVADARPTLAWSEHPGIYQFRVQVESRIPNGRVLSRIDQTVPGTSFTPPRALADEPAVVKVRITANCPPEAQPGVSELGPAFFVDPRASCPAPSRIEVRADKTLRVSWVSSPRASHTEVAVFTAADGALLARQSVAGSDWESALPDRIAAIALRARCSEAFSAMVYRVLAGAR